MNELRLQYQKDTGKSVDGITDEIEGFQHDVVVNESIIKDLETTVDSLKADIANLRTEYFTVVENLNYLPDYIKWLEDKLELM